MTLGLLLLLSPCPSLQRQPGEGSRLGEEQPALCPQQEFCPDTSGKTHRAWGAFGAEQDCRRHRGHFPAAIMSPWISEREEFGAWLEVRAVSRAASGALQLQPGPTQTRACSCGCAGSITERISLQSTAGREQQCHRSWGMLQSTQHPTAATLALSLLSLSLLSLLPPSKCKHPQRRELLSANPSLI